jgi:beta-phosphoglucomutase-like phosphatase (HAD superfamily)
MIKAIIFDMDGVIFNTENIWALAYINANHVFNINLSDDVRKSFCGKSEELVKKDLIKLFPNLDIIKYRKYIHDYVNNSIKENKYEVKKGFFELINYLKNNNYKIALASSSDRNKINNLFKNKNIDLNIFDSIISGDDVLDRGKPDPYIFNLVSKYFNIDSKNICVLEDSINGIMAAYNGNFIPVMVKDLLEPNDFCIKNCDAILDNLLEVIDYLKNK